MKFTENMNGWGRAGVVIFYVWIALMLLAFAILQEPLTLPEIVGGVIGLVGYIFFFKRLEEGTSTNGTFFTAALIWPSMLPWILGGLAQLINGNPKKKSEVTIVE